MADRELRPHHLGCEAPCSRLYSPDLQPLLQSLLATLGNMDFEHEREREKLSASAGDADLKMRALEKLKRQHRERREPYIRQLAILQERIRSVVGAGR
jgi:hypothetical protein